MFRRTSISLVFTLLPALLATAAAAQDYKARPVIDALEPAAGPPGTQVRIKGQNLGPEYKVFYNNIAVQPISASNKEIVVQIPPNAVQGRFTLQGPMHRLTSQQVFWVVQARVAPVVTNLEPTIGPPGTAVIVTGSNFSAKAHENAVTIGGAPLMVRSASPTRIEAIISPTAKTGNITVQVYNAGQATSQKAFTVLAQIKIDALSPPSGPPGTKVKIIGSGFSDKKANIKVTLGGKPVKLLSSSANEIVVEIPMKGAEAGRFAVEIKGVGSFEFPTAFPVVFPPVISGITPTSGPIGTEIVIKGKGFGANQAAAQVTLTGRPCAVTSVTDSEIHAFVPQGAGSGKLQVTVAQMGMAESKEGFEVWAPLAVTRMEPMWGVPGTEVRLWGTGFRSNPADHTLYIGSAKVPVSQIENGVIIFKIPQEVPDGPLTLTLEVKERGSAPIAFPLQVAHSPEIANITPTRGSVGTLVTITGKYFSDQASHLRLTLNGQVIAINAVTPTALTFAVPLGATNGPIEIQTKRRGNAKSKAPFEVFTPVQVTSVVPTGGIVGSAVTIFGGGFEAVAKNNKVTLSGKPVTVLEAGESRLKVQVPKGATTGKFRVEVKGRGFGEPPLNFAVVNPINVKTFKPDKGTPGTYVRITGEGFDNPGLRCYLAQMPIGVRVESPTMALVMIPPGAPSGQFVFTAPNAGRTESKSAFSVLTPLTVTGFRPPTGPDGTKVSIYGTGFDLKAKATTVTYGSAILKVEPGSSETMLVVSIPKSAPDAPFKVAVKDRGEVESENVFAVSRPVGAAQNAPLPTAPAAAAPSAAPAAPTAAQAPAKAPPAPPAAAPQQPPSMDNMLGIDASVIPTLVSFDPTSSPVGETIMITGTNFGEDMATVKAWVGDVPAEVIGVVPDMVMISVPTGVKRGKIRL
ncbi:MAG: IPT/TIG domain-containing protein, partial [Myxococcota bacterium]|nr:IPT/TIG domain-containing protein [Myxococcota bacterium]